jgi:nucleotide-binding universal stress UspA family protein
MKRIGEAIMFNEIIACLDGSSLAEKILPLARGITAPEGGRLTLLRVVQHTNELAQEETYLRDCARQYSAELRFRVAADPTLAILEELERNPRSIAALTTHGRTAWAEAILGSVALPVIRGAKRPVIVLRPLDSGRKPPKRITTIALGLDGTGFSEKMISPTVKAAQTLSAKLLLLHALPVHPNLAPLADREKSDVLESSYLRGKAADIKAEHGIDAQWEVLHGEAGDAISRYLNDMPDTLLAMTTHARSAVERAVLGSVAGYCIRHAGVPLLLYWPQH